RTMKPSPTSPSMNAACASQPDCSSSSFDASHSGPLAGERRGTSLLVSLDDVWIANPRTLRVIARIAQRAPLSQEVPALVEPDLDRIEPAVLGLGQTAFGASLVELVLLGDELLDAVVD